MFDREGPLCYLEWMNPGAPLTADLASIDVDELAAHDQVVVLRHLQRMASHFQARVYATITALAEHMEATEFPDDPELAWQATATEIRTALHLTRRTAEAELDLALQLKRRLPRVWNALLRGSIDQRRARVIADNTSHLDEDTARRVVHAVIDDASGLTTGQLAGRVRRLTMEVAPETVAQRYTEAVDRRRIMLDATPDGTTTLTGLDLPPNRALAAANHVDELAKALNRQGDSRNIDQLRADVFLDLLNGQTTGASGGVVEMTVDLDTLAELAAHPGDLAGYGPVVADIARQVAQAQTEGEWKFTITDPATGLPVHDGTTRRRPTARQRRSVIARDQRCVFPGCRMPAAQSDLDHGIPWATKHQTSTPGMAALCRHDHHTIRHKAGWDYRPLEGGDYLWTSPLGHRYTTSGRSP